MPCALGPHMADLEFVNFLDPFSRHALLQAEIGARQPTSRSAGSQALEGSRGLALWFWRPPINGLLSWRPWKPHRSKVGSGDQPTYHQHFQPYHLDIAEQDLEPIAQRNRLISTVQHYSNTMSGTVTENKKPRDAAAGCRTQK